MTEPEEGWNAQEPSSNGRPAHVPMPPPLPLHLADLSERQTWALDAFDTISDAQRAEAKARGDIGRFGEAYILILTVVLLFAMGFSGMRGLFTPTCAACAPVLRSALGVGIASAASGGIVLLSGLLGPLGLGRARLLFLGHAPADRAVVVRGPLRATVLGSSLAGVLAGGAIALATLEARAGTAPLVIVSAFIGGLVGAALVLLPAVVQPRRGASAATVRIGGTLLGLGSLTLVLAVHPVSTTLFAPAPLTRSGALSGALLPGLAAGALLVAALTLTLARRVPDSARKVRAVELARGGDVAEAVLSSTLSLDLGATEALAERRSLARRGRFRSRRLGVRGPWALARTDVRRVLRAPLPLLVAATCVPIPAVVASLLGATTATVVALLLAVAIGNATASGLRTWTRSTALQRGLPLGRVAVRLAFLLAPACVVTLWSVAAFALSGLDGSLWSVLNLGVYAAVLRCAGPSTMAEAASMVAVTPMGAMPVGVISSLLRGPDIAALPLALALLGEPTLGVLSAGLFLWWQLVSGAALR